MLEQGEKCERWRGERSSREELLWTDHNPHSLSPSASGGLWEKEAEELGVKERRRAWEEGEKDF